MIQANELRIGNFINSRFSKDKYRMVTKIEHNSIDTNKDDNLSTDHIEPIPITKEWLLKLGFIFDEITEYFTEENVYVKYYNDFGIKIEENGTFYNGIYQQKFKYVHQLQNLYFALTGIELNIQ